MSNIIAEMFLVSIHNKFRNSALERNSDMKQKSLGVNALLNGIKQCCSIIFPLITFGAAFNFVCKFNCNYNIR